jgi:hypothetical protein
VYLEIDVLERWSRMLHLWRLYFFTCSASGHPILSESWFKAPSNLPWLYVCLCLLLLEQGLRKSSVKRKLGLRTGMCYSWRTWLEYAGASEALLRGGGLTRQGLVSGDCVDDAEVIKMGT